MSRTRVHLCLAALLLPLLLLAGCESVPPPESLPAGPLDEFYPGELVSVDRIDLRSGMSGEWRTVTGPEVIRDWVSKAGDLPFSPDPSQAQRAGFNYIVILFEKGEEKFSFLPTQFGKHYYIPDPQFSPLLDELFEKGTKPVPGRY
ncbi:hypothetical protein [Paenibacillus mucilaginosus]|uniref:Lipoprotein n=1 Tax=Paenibacillus mucilaginosus (strain KNP414) TaxID=1036673 RepID=F8FMH9_PAEMK|nr:hypothetical protein [Paenibacillus mucilaginosus]AEI40062.1 hypothetical protein KNP414_01498 [Paenibacillus mucilaginosus KNP414]MCG7215669.1 hypothetical protein [Paenibacillus mucilaginosus]WDM29302.1 hypothetical protein KCX80_09155 [Paenibacillus mucilaginosus]